MKQQDKLQYVLQILDGKLRGFKKRLEECEWRKNFDNTLSNSHFSRLLKQIDKHQDAVDSLEYCIRYLTAELSSLNYLERMRSSD